MSIPRRVFYDICKAYLPYKDHVIATFSRLFVSFLVIILLFSMIVHFQVMNEFSEVGAIRTELAKQSFQKNFTAPFLAIIANMDSQIGNEFCCIKHRWGGYEQNTLL